MFLALYVLCMVISDNYFRCFKGNYLKNTKVKGLATELLFGLFFFFFFALFPIHWLLCTHFPRFTRMSKLTLFSILARISENLDYKEHPSSRMPFAITLIFDDTSIPLWFGRMGDVLISEKVYLLPDASFWVIRMDVINAKKRTWNLS